MTVLLEDSTLREGEQSPGVVFRPADKVEIVRRLEAAGVTAMEVGTPVMGGAEADAIRQLATTTTTMRLIGWNRGRREDIEASLRCGLRSVHIGLPSSDAHISGKFRRSRSWVIDTMRELVAFAKADGLWVSVSAEDAGRADRHFLIEYATAVADAGADRMRISDTVGVLDPFAAHDLFQVVSSKVPSLDLQAHMHNDFGLATANTLAAVRGGARHVHVTVNGLGERAGIAPLDEVVMGLGKHLGIDVGVRTELLTDISRFVAEASGRPLPANKPVTGDAMFAHESGIHVDGILKDASSFEPFPPETIGGTRRIVIGKHTGRAAVQHVLSEQGIKLGDEVAGRLVASTRARATELGRALTTDELVALFEAEAGAA